MGQIRSHCAGVESTADKYWDYFQPTLSALRGAPLERLTDIPDRVPHNRISYAARAFAKEMLRVAYESLRKDWFHENLVIGSAGAHRQSGVSVGRLDADTERSFTASVIRKA